MLFVVLLFVAVATITDVLQHKIYNWTTYSGSAAAFLLSVVGAVLVGTARVEEQRLVHWGWVPPAASGAGLAVCGLIMLVCYVFFAGIGGGDVKLIAMLGAFLGPERGVEAMLWTFVFGACAGLIMLIWRVGPARLAARAMRQLLWTLRFRAWAPLGEDERASLRPPLHLAPCALAAVLMVQFSPLLGRLLP